MSGVISGTSSPVMMATGAVATTTVTAVNASPACISCNNSTTGLPVIFSPTLGDHSIHEHHHPFYRSAHSYVIFQSLETIQSSSLATSIRDVQRLHKTLCSNLRISYDFPIKKGVRRLPSNYITNVIRMST